MYFDSTVTHCYKLLLNYYYYCQAIIIIISTIFHQCTIELRGSALMADRSKRASISSSNSPTIALKIREEDTNTTVSESVFGNFHQCSSMFNNHDLIFS